MYEKLSQVMTTAADFKAGATSLMMNSIFFCGEFDHDFWDGFNVYLIIDFDDDLDQYDFVGVCLFCFVS